MGSPYLSKGESITLTTHRVGVESVPYDVMLTTHRLTLIDSRYARFEPLMIAFEDILTVKSGAASTGEPVIILTYTDADECVRMMNLIFSQQPGEHRKHERDLWVKKLMESIIDERTGPAGANEDPVEEPGAMKPSIRRWVAPEGIALHTPFAAKEPEQPEITIIPDDEEPFPEQSESLQDPDGAPQEEFADPDTGTSPEKDPVPAPSEITRASHEAPEYNYGITGEDGEDEFIAAPSEELDPLQKFQTIVIPFVSLERPPAPPVRETEPKTVTGETIQAAAQSLIPEETAYEATDNAALPEDLARPDLDQAKESDTESAITPAGPGPSRERIAEESEGSDPDLAKKAGPQESGRSANALSILPGEPQPGQKAFRKDSGDLKEQEESTAGAGSRGANGSPEKQAGTGQDGRKDMRIPGRSPAGAASQRGILIVLLIIAVLVVAGAGVLLINYSGNNESAQVPSPVPEAAGIPAAAPAVLTIPASGAGFRVSYEGEYAGEIGNPGQMKLVSGSGDTFFPVQKYNGLVQASIQKQDNSGKTLTIEVYNNAKMIYTRSVSTPKGSLDILIDAGTGTVAGMTPTKDAANQTVQSRPLYY